MITQKLYRNGNSVAVTIPKQYLQALNLKEGSSVVVEQRRGEVVIKLQKKSVQGIDQQFAKVVDEFITDHKDVLAEIAKR